MADVLPQTCALIQQGIADRLHLGAQIFVQQGERIIANLAMGESQSGVAMTIDTINPWLSAGKPIAAVAIAQLWERGLLDWDDRVAKFIPEFAAGGKEPITIRHILTHTAGFRAVIGLRWDDSYEVAIRKICEARIEPRWVIGQTAGYHPMTSWYILAEIVHRLDGRVFEQYVREAIFLPLGMKDSWFAMPADLYRGYGSRIGSIYDTSGFEPRLALHGNGEEDAAIVRPGASGRGPIRELGRFYEMLMKRGESLIRAETAQLLTEAHRIGSYDLTFKQVMDWGLGFIVNTHSLAEAAYGYGPHASARTYGHSGNQSSCAFCDPEQKLVVGWFCNGMPGQQGGEERQRRLNEAIYADLQMK